MRPSTLEALYHDPLWQAGFDTVWDGRGLTELFMEMKDFSRFLQMQSHYEETGRGRDVVVALRPLDYMMAKIYEIKARGRPRPFHVVRTEPEVAQILGG